MSKAKTKPVQIPIELDLESDRARTEFLQDLTDNPPPVKTASVVRRKGHKEKPCSNPQLVFVGVLGMNKERTGYMRCMSCGMFHEWVGNHGVVKP